MILLLIPLGGLVLGLALWFGMRGLGALAMGADPGPSWSDRRESWREKRESWRDRREARGPVSIRTAAPDSVREWADRIPQGCLIAVIVASAVWVLGWLIFLIYGLNLLS